MREGQWERWDMAFRQSTGSVEMPVSGDSWSRGQGLVEFSLAIVAFLAILFGVVDFGRGIYQFNAVSQAAREIARVTSVHLCAAIETIPPSQCVFAGGVLNPADYSAETQDVINVQKGLIPSLAEPVITCVHASGAPLGSEPCDITKDSLNVVIVAPFKAVTPPMSAWVQWDMKGASSAQIQ
jgi:hypothetical protein